MRVTGKFLIFFFVFPHLLYPQYRKFNFEQISVTQGLSQSVIYSIHEDRYGFIWFGSKLGLKKFDGYKFINYQLDPDNLYGLSKTDVRSIIEEPSADFWVGTMDGGLNLFDRASEKFIPFKIKNDTSHTKEPIHVLCTLKDQFGKLWIGTAGTGLYFFDPQLKTLKKYFNDREVNRGPISNYIISIHEDSQGIIWIGTNMGLSCFDRKNQMFTHYKNDPHLKGSLSNNFIWSIAEDKSGNVFFGTYNGLNKFDRRKFKFLRYFYEPVKTNVGSKNIIRCMIYAKHSNQLWIATGEGLSIFNPENDDYINFYEHPNTYDNLEDRSVSAIYEDRSGLIWVAAFSGEIFKYNPDRRKFIH